MQSATTGRPLWLASDQAESLFAAVTVIILALGIGANTAIFSLLDALMLRNLPVWRPDRLVEIAATYRNGAKVPFSFPVFQQLQQNQRVFTDLFAWTAGLRYSPSIRPSGDGLAAIDGSSCPTCDNDH